MRIPSFQQTKAHRARFGTGKTMLTVLDGLVNRVLRTECYHVIVLDRAKVADSHTQSTSDTSVRLATSNELLDMHNQGTWLISDFLLNRAEEGDLCFLNFCDGELAGYTWANVNGQPLLFPNLRLRLPDHYLYNYAGFTLPKFRGWGLQSVRHRALMHHKQWSEDTRGLVGYVSYTNWASIKGQTKSGYRTIGNLWLFGTKNHFVTFRSRAVRDFGIARIRDFVPADAVNGQVDVPGDSVIVPTPYGESGVG
jgi:hypothetical protein